MKNATGWILSAKNATFCSFERQISLGWRCGQSAKVKNKVNYLVKLLKKKYRGQDRGQAVVGELNTGIGFLKK